MTASVRSVRLAGVSSCAFIAAAVALLLFFPRFEVPEIHGFVVHPPYIWWAFGGLLLVGVLVTAVKLASNMSLFKIDALNRGGPLEVKPKWVKLVEEIISAVMDG